MCGGGFDHYGKALSASVDRALRCFAAGMSRRNRRKRRNFYSLALINYVTQMAQIGFLLA
jgi:hypothetical protein